jgi:kynurenine formamidase
MTRDVPSDQDVRGWLEQGRNWGRWGDDDQRGTVNLMTPEKIVAACRLVKSGRTVSLSSPLPTDVGPHNLRPVVHMMRKGDWKYGAGTAGDYLGMYSHGHTTTHLDALCHVWDADGMYNGRQASEIDFSGAKFGGIEHWADGIVTRGVILDVPRFRGTDHVTFDRPIHGWELEELTEAQGIRIEPGDALCIYSGRDSWQAHNPDKPYGVWKGELGGMQQPGLHASCLPFLRHHDVGALVWDMMDFMSDEEDYGVPFTVHGAICSYGLALIDNAQLVPLARASLEEGRADFLFVTAPLVVTGGTASPVNPLAIF